MSGVIWNKFYWSDWDSDEALRQCSLAAQGLWMRMLCICAKGEPTGYLTIRGVPLDATGVSIAVGRPETEVAPLMAELSKWGVYSQDRKGRIYSRRMIRDKKKAAISQNNGRKGGNPSISKQRGISPRVNPPDKPPDKPHKPDTNNQERKEKTPSGSKRKATRLPDDWDPDADLLAWAAEKFPNVDLDLELDTFRDYWRGAPGQRGCKLDWPATFRNWIRRSRGGRSPKKDPAMAALDRLERGANEKSGKVIRLA